MTLERYVGLGRETVFAEAAEASRYIESNALLNPDQGWIISSPICDSSRSRYNLGAFRTRGNFGPFEVTPNNIGEIINAIMSGGLYSYFDYGSPACSRRHTWKCSNLLDSYTLRSGAEIEERILAGMIANKLQFKASHGENLQATIEWVGPGTSEATGALANLSRSDVSALQPFVYYNASGLVSIGDSEKSGNVFDFEIEVDNKIPFQRGSMSSRFMAKKRYGSRTVIGKISAYFDDDDEYDRFIAGEPFILDLTFRGSLIAQNRYYELRFLLSKCVYLRDVGHPVARRDEPLVLDCPFQGLYDAINTELLIELENAEFIEYYSAVECPEGEQVGNGDFTSNLEYWTNESWVAWTDGERGKCAKATNTAGNLSQVLSSETPVSCIESSSFYFLCSTATNPTRKGLLEVEIVYTDDSSTVLSDLETADDAWEEYDLLSHYASGKTVREIIFRPSASSTYDVLLDTVSILCP
jgi:hypothetical protein